MSAWNSLLAASRARPARDAEGKAAVVEPAALAAWQAQLAAHPLLDRIAGGVERFRITRYLAGYAVMSAGEAPDRFGIVLGGRCRVFADGDDGLRNVGWVGRGEVLGELSLLSGAERRFTVIAERDTVIAELDRGDFEALVAVEPRLEARLGAIVAARVAGRARRPREMSLTVVPLGDLDAAAFAAELADALRAHDPDDSVRIVTRDALSSAAPAFEIEAIERAHTFVLYVADPADPAWTARAVRQADRVLLVADAADDPRLRGVEALDRVGEAPRFLILRQPPDIAVASGTARWIEPRALAGHLHVRRGHAADLGRCARIVTGRARGVAFTGASSRGVGYTGMARAFAEVGFAPDIIAGNSSGAFAALWLATGRSFAEFERAYVDGLAEYRPRWSRLTPPLVSLVTGARLRRFLRGQLGDLRLEDLLVPCILTAVDLEALAMVDLDRGPAWIAARASTSLPIYYPPVERGGRLLIDGGVIENIPTRPLEPACARGCIVVCDLTPTADHQDRPFHGVEPYGDQLSGWRVLWHRLWPFGRRRYPMLPAVVLSIASAASLRHQAEYDRRTIPGHILIRPPLPPISLFGLDETLRARVIAACHAHAREVLAGHPDPALRAALDRPAA